MNVLILGTRGIPARHGGFETFAEHLAVFLARRGHVVSVYCQSDTERETGQDTWQGVTRIHLFGGPGPMGTIRFDYNCVRDAVKRSGLILTLGYNTAIFSVFYSLARRTSIMNMDGIEWKRDKWSLPQRIWLRLNEVAGAWLSTHLIADHPRIAQHLETLVPAGKITMIPYGADPPDTGAAGQPIHPIVGSIGVEPGKYVLVVARAEPENSLLEIVAGFSAKMRPIPLVVLGNYDPQHNAYHAKVLASGSAQVLFPGAFYAPGQLTALRRHALLYVHGHRVGGTNPSLVEALAAGNAVLAQDNAFNRWVAGPGALYFQDAASLSEQIDTLLTDPSKLQEMHEASYARYTEDFQQEPVLEAYEKLLLRFSGPSNAV